MLQIGNERHREVGSVNYMVDVVVLVRRFFYDLLNRMHRRVDDRGSNAIVMQEMAAVADWDFVSIGGFRILNDRAGLAVQRTALQRCAKYLIVLFLSQLRRITLPSLVAIVSCRICFYCLARSAASRADDGQFPPLDSLRYGSRWKRLWKIVCNFSRRGDLIATLALAKSTAAAVDPSWRV
jgi:hypothetical protein